MNFEQWQAGNGREPGKWHRCWERLKAEEVGNRGETIGWHHQLSGHESEQTLGDSEGQGSMACCHPWGCRVRHSWVTEQRQATAFLQSPFPCRNGFSVSTWTTSMRHVNIPYFFPSSSLSYICDDQIKCQCSTFWFGLCCLMLWISEMKHCLLLLLLITTLTNVY